MLPDPATRRARSWLGVTLKNRTGADNGSVWGAPQGYLLRARALFHLLCQLHAATHQRCEERRPLIRAAEREDT